MRNKGIKPYDFEDLIIEKSKNVFLAGLGWKCGRGSGALALYHKSLYSSAFKQT